MLKYILFTFKYEIINIHVLLTLLCLISYNNACSLHLAEFFNNGFHVKSSVDTIFAATENIFQYKKCFNIRKYKYALYYIFV